MESILSNYRATAYQLMKDVDGNDDRRIDFAGRLTYHIKSRINGRHFPDDIFKWILIKYLDHDKNFIEVCSQGSNRIWWLYRSTLVEII